MGHLFIEGLIPRLIPGVRYEKKNVSISKNVVVFPRGQYFKILLH
jgi:hypothetical protein